jgi:hypothetical protein
MSQSRERRRGDIALSAPLSVERFAAHIMGGTGFFRIMAAAGRRAR